MTRNTDLSLKQIFNLNFGFFGVQIAYALQSANISRIFATLGADPHQLSFFWILPPLMGMIVQPLVGKYSDRTWCRMGRRKPYLLGGAIVALLVMMMLPNAGSIDFGARLFLGLFNCSICLPQIIAAACGGALLRLIGGSQAAMFIIAAALLICGAACVGLIKEHDFCNTELKP